MIIGNAEIYATLVDGMFRLSTTGHGTPIQIRHIAAITRQYTVFVLDTRTWSILKEYDPYAHELLQSQLDAMVDATRWYSIARWLVWISQPLPYVVRNQVVTQWLMRTKEPNTVLRLIALYEHVQSMKRVYSRREA